MITKAQRKELKKVLGHNYTKKVREILFKKGIRNRNGLPHTAVNIRVVMNGQEHEEIEAAIFEAYEKQQKKLEKEAARRAALLNNKTEAPTSVHWV